MEKIQELIKWLDEQQNKSLKFYSESLKQGDKELATQFTGEHVAFALAADKVKELFEPRAGVVENFAHKPSNEMQTEALNKHDVGGRSEQLAAFLRWYWKEVDGKPYEISAEEVVNQFGG